MWYDEDILKCTYIAVISVTWATTLQSGHLPIYVTNCIPEPYRATSTTLNIKEVAWGLHPLPEV